MLDGPASAAFAGAALGLSAGLSPGPLLALVIAQTLAYSFREGLKVAAAPLLTDLPIVLAALLLTARLGEHPRVLGLLTLCGAGYLGWLAWESMRFGPQIEGATPERPKSLRKGMLANFLNPSPYLFWGSVGAPLLSGAWSSGAGTAVAFLVGFYVSIVGAKAGVAALTSRFGPVLGSRAYALIMRGLGLGLAACAAWFVRDAWRLLAG